MNAATAALRREHLFMMALALPALVLFVLFFGIPVLRLLALSVEGFSLQWFAKALTSPLYFEVFRLTAVIALAVTTASLLIGFPVAFLLATTSAGWRAFGFLVIMLPLWTSVLVRTYAWMVLLGRNGVINRSLLALGVIDQPLPLLYNLNGVLLGMIHVLLPYMVLPIYAALRRIDPDLVRAAEGLGAPAWRIFLRVYLPLTLPGIAAGVVLVFVLALGFFITPALLGGGKVVMIAVLIQQQAGEVLDWNFAAALSTLLVVATVLAYALVQGWVERRERTA
jgi:ABC-type spermidine/putrescine transport system permease subunit I